MTNLANLSNEYIGEGVLKSTDLITNSIDKKQKVKVLKELSNPDNKHNKKVTDVTSSAHLNARNSELCTSTPKFSNKPLKDDSLIGRYIGDNATSDSGFYESCQNSFFGVSSFNSSINGSFSNGFSKEHFKSTPPKKKELLSRSAKSLRKSPSSMSRNRLKAQAKNNLNSSFFSNVKTRELSRKISFSSSMNGSFESVKLSKATPLSGQMDSSCYYSASSTQTIKSSNQSVNDTANDSYISLVNACGKVSLSNPLTTTSHCKSDKNWKQVVDINIFEKVIKKFKPQNGYLIGSKMGLYHFDIISNVFNQNIFDFTSKLFSYLSVEDYIRFDHVCTSWKRIVKWHTSVDSQRKEYLENSRNFFYQNEQNIYKSTSSHTTSTHTPLKQIQLASMTQKRKCHSDQHDIFQHEASQLLNHQHLMKCPLCLGASRVDGLKALCSRHTCGLQFCSKCLRWDHAFGVICPQETTH